MKENEAFYLPMQLLRFNFEIDTPEGEIYKIEEVLPLRYGETLIDCLGVFINKVLFQMGYPLFNKRLVPLLSINIDELEPLIKFLKQLRTDNGEEPITSIDFRDESGENEGEE